MYKRINDYGIIGNLVSCALVGIDGSIDWCCLPHLDSPAVFCAILDDKRGGRFQIVPEGQYRSTQSYIHNTSILETRFTTPTGKALLTDFMPFSGTGYGDDMPVIYRLVTGISGTIQLEAIYQPKPDYGRTKTRLEADQNIITLTDNNPPLTLVSTIPIEIYEDEAFAIYNLKQGERIAFALIYGDDTGPVSDIDTVFETTAEAWKRWAHTCDEEVCVFGGPWHDMVVRSAFTLKLLTHGHTGAVAAAATASLPEEIGGERNWDYRFSWLRDSSFTVQALHNLGHRREAEAFLDWFQGIMSQHTDPSGLRIMYGLHGETELNETVLKHLEGYRGSRPVRIGNGAVEQKQLDIYGEVMDAAYQLTRYGRRLDEKRLPFLKKIADYVCDAWKEEDAGIWEVRGGYRHFVYSKVMCWVALDRAIRLFNGTEYSDNIERWKDEASAIHRTVMDKGYDEGLGSFVQSFGSRILDASNLLIPLMGFLPFDHPRVKGTIDATIRELSDGVFVHRYNGEDGISGKEGAFLLCSFWLVDCLVLSGRVKEGEELFKRLMDSANHLGLFPEEIDPNTGEFLGNFPQAFTHIGFINSALYLGRASNRMQMGPPPAGISE